MNFLLGIKGKLIMVIGILMGVIALLMRLFFLGKASAKAEDLGESLRRAEVARNVEKDISRVSDDELRDRLRDNGWLRD